MKGGAPFKVRRSCQWRVIFRMLEGAFPAGYGCSGGNPSVSDRSLSEEELSAMADALAASGHYRVLRQIRPRPKLEVPSGTDLKQGIFLDVETTGLDPQTDEVLELAMVPFTYGQDGRIYEVREAFQRFNQPKKPIPPEITKLTGITDAMVAGHAIDPSEVEAFMDYAIRHPSVCEGNSRFPGREVKPCAFGENGARDGDAWARALGTGFGNWR